MEFMDFFLANKILVGVVAGAVLLIVWKGVSRIIKLVVVAAAILYLAVRYGYFW